MKKITIITSLVFSLLVACQSVDAPQSLEPAPLFTDADIDNAIPMPEPELKVVELKDMGEIVDGVELPDLPDVEVDSDFSTQTVLPNVFGHIYYIRHKNAIYSIFKHDQTNDHIQNIYQGNREIQSVVGTTGNYVYLSMREYAGGRFQIYRLDLGSNLVINLSVNFDNNINVTAADSGNIIAYEVKSESGSKVIKIDLVGDTQASIYPGLREPSLQRDGSSFVAVKDLNNGKDRIVRIYANDSVKNLISSKNSLTHPSITSDNIESSRVIWLQHNATRDLIRIKNLSTGNIQTIVKTGVNRLEHPFFAREVFLGTNGYMTYGHKRQGRISVYTKNISTGETTLLKDTTSGDSYFGMTWVW